MRSRPVIRASREYDEALAVIDVDPEGEHVAHLAGVVERTVAHLREAGLEVARRGEVLYGPPSSDNRRVVHRQLKIVNHRHRDLNGGRGLFRPPCS